MHERIDSESRGALREAIHRFAAGSAGTDRAERDASGRAPVGWWDGLDELGVLGLDAAPEPAAWAMPTAVAAIGAHDAGLAHAAAHVLRARALSSGQLATLALPVGPDGSPAPPTASEGRLRARLAPVAATAWAERLLLPIATDDGSALLTLPISEVRIEPLDTVGLRTAGLASVEVDAAVADATPLAEGALLEALEVGWVLEAAAALADARTALAAARAHVEQREAFGRPIARFQAIAHRLVDADAALVSGEALLEETIATWHAHGGPGALAAPLRARAVDVAAALADEALQLHGGSGYTAGTIPERGWRDARQRRLLDVDEGALRVAVAEGASSAPPAPPAIPTFDAEHERLRDRARELIEREIVERADAWERDGGTPRELFARVGEAGMLGLGVAADVGGSGPDPVAQAVWAEELARATPGGVAADLGAHADLAMRYIERGGGPAARARFLPAAARGDAIGALAITEPGAGSDVAAIATRARREGDGWRLEGSKVFITNGSWCDHLVVAAKVGAEDGAPGDDPHQQITLFVVETDQAGLERRRLRMLGWNASHTGELWLDGAWADDAHRLGDVGAGFGQIMGNFAWERLVLALGAVAASAAALERLAATPEPPTAAIGELRPRVLAARALAHRALRTLAATERAGRDAVDPVLLRDVGAAKLCSQRLAVEVAEAELAAGGLAASLSTSPAQRAWRDARLGPIGGGTDEIMREILKRLPPS